MIKAAKLLISEHINNLKRIIAIGSAHSKKQTKQTSLGLGWIFISDIIYFCAYVMFRWMISGSKEVEGMHFIVYLITGKIAWNFMSDVLNRGSLAIKRNSSIIKSISFPISIIPTYEVVAIFVKRISTLIIPVVIILIFGDITKINILLFIYYFICMFILMVVINQITSALVAVSEDFNQLYSALTRILFFTLPILWDFERIAKVSTILVRLVKVNPMVYIIIGFRNAFVLNNPPALNYTIYFWSIIIVLFFTGAYLQYRLRSHYVDFI